MRKLLHIVIVLLLAGFSVVASAEPKWDYPHAAYVGSLRSEQGDIPAQQASIYKRELGCKKNPCLIVVNNVDESKIEQLFMSAGDRDEKGNIVWGTNMLPAKGVGAKSFLFWEWKKPPALASCPMDVKMVVHQIGHPDNIIQQVFDFCGPHGTGFLVLRDPDDPVVKNATSAASSTPAAADMASNN